MPQSNRPVAVITGATSGIGLATCRKLGDAGWNIVAVGRSIAGLRTVTAGLQQSGVEAIGFALDVRNENDMDLMARGAIERFGRIDALVASAGLLRAGRPHLVQNTPTAEWDVVMDTNLRGVFLSNRAVLPAMTTQGHGVIVNLSSTSGRRGLAYDAAYCASKFAVIGFSEALREEVRRHGVNVHVVLPGPVDTPIWKQNAPIPQLEPTIPPQRLADLILYLLTHGHDVQIPDITIVPFRHEAKVLFAHPEKVPMTVTRNYSDVR